MEQKNENKTDIELIKEFITDDMSEEEREILIEEIKLKEAQNSSCKKFDTDEAWDKLYERFEENNLIPEEKTSPIIRMYPKFMKIAAVILVFLTLSFVSFYVYNINQIVNYKTVSNTEVKEIKLPDGSKIILNSGSNIKYPEKFSDDIRKIEFTGEGFFEIAKMPEKPFIIVAADAQVKVLGTSFNVNTNSKQKVEVTVKTGKVQLSDKKNPEKNIKLRSGFTGILTKEKLSKNKTENLNYLSWKTHKFYYKKEKLSKVISDLNKIYKTNITFDDEKIGEFEITTKLENKQIETIMVLICTSHPFKYQKTGNNILLSFDKK